RIALLLADTPLPKVTEQYGDYYIQFSKFLQKGVVSSKKQITLDIKPYDIVTKMEYPNEQDLLEIDGILITGSAASAYVDIPWINRLVEFVSSTINEHPKVKIVGICFGHQIVARAMGGQVIKNSLGWEVAVTDFSLTYIGKEFFKTNREVRLQEMHQDHVSSIPPNFSNIGFSEICPIQGMIKDDHVFTIQGHPEFVSGVVKEIVKSRQEKQIFTPELAQKYLIAADYNDDSI
ncbi:class I glutamine amidotransferase-like protein, partial [Glomus cerebriforme]